jgi:hypothetical protein
VRLLEINLVPHHVRLQKLFHRLLAVKGDHASVTSSFLEEMLRGSKVLVGLAQPLRSLPNLTSPTHQCDYAP